MSNFETNEREKKRSKFSSYSLLSRTRKKLYRKSGNTTTFANDDSTMSSVFAGNLTMPLHIKTPNVSVIQNNSSYFQKISNSSKSKDYHLKPSSDDLTSTVKQKQESSAYSSTTERSKRVISIGDSFSNPTFKPLQYKSSYPPDSSEHLLSWMKSLKLKAESTLKKNRDEEQEFYNNLSAERRQINNESSVKEEEFKKLENILKKSDSKPALLEDVPSDNHAEVLSRPLESEAPITKAESFEPFVEEEELVPIVDETEGYNIDEFPELLSESEYNSDSEVDSDLKSSADDSELEVIELGSEPENVSDKDIVSDKDKSVQQYSSQISSSEEEMQEEELQYSGEELESLDIEQEESDNDLDSYENLSAADANHGYQPYMNPFSLKSSGPHMGGSVNSETVSTSSNAQYDSQPDRKMSDAFSVGNSVGQYLENDSDEEIDLNEQNNQGQTYQVSGTDSSEIYESEIREDSENDLSEEVAELDPDQYVSNDSEGDFGYQVNAEDLQIVDQAPFEIDPSLIAAAVQRSIEIDDSNQNKLISEGETNDDQDKVVSSEQRETVTSELEGEINIDDNQSPASEGIFGANLPKVPEDMLGVEDKHSLPSDSESSSESEDAEMNESVLDPALVQLLEGSLIKHEEEAEVEVSSHPQPSHIKEDLGHEKVEPIEPNSGYAADVDTDAFLDTDTGAASGPNISNIPPSSFKFQEASPFDATEFDAPLTDNISDGSIADESSAPSDGELLEQVEALAPAKIIDPQSSDAQAEFETSQPPFVQLDDDDVNKLYKEEIKTHTESPSINKVKENLDAIDPLLLVPLLDNHEFIVEDIFNNKSDDKTEAAKEAVPMEDLTAFDNSAELATTAQSANEEFLPIADVSHEKDEQNLRVVHTKLVDEPEEEVIVENLIHEYSSYETFEHIDDLSEESNLRIVHGVSDSTPATNERFSYFPETGTQDETHSIREPNQNETVANSDTPELESAQLPDIKLQQVELADADHIKLDVTELSNSERSSEKEQEKKIEAAQLSNDDSLDQPAYETILDRDGGGNNEDFSTNDTDAQNAANSFDERKRQRDNIDKLEDKPSKRFRKLTSFFGSFLKPSMESNALNEDSKISKLDIPEITVISSPTTDLENMSDSNNQVADSQAFENELVKLSSLVDVGAENVIESDDVSELKVVSEKEDAQRSPSSVDEKLEPPVEPLEDFNSKDMTLTGNENDDQNVKPRINDSSNDADKPEILEVAPAEGNIGDTSMGDIKAAKDDVTSSFAEKMGSSKTEEPISSVSPQKSSFDVTVHKLEPEDHVKKVPKKSPKKRVSKPISAFAAINKRKTRSSNILGDNSEAIESPKGISGNEISNEGTRKISDDTNNEDQINKEFVELQNNKSRGKKTNQKGKKSELKPAAATRSLRSSSYAASPSLEQSILDETQNLAFSNEAPKLTDDEKAETFNENETSKKISEVVLPPAASRLRQKKQKQEAFIDLIPSIVELPKGKKRGRTSSSQEDISENESQNSRKLKNRVSSDPLKHITMRTRSGKYIGANTSVEIANAEEQEKLEELLISGVASGDIRANTSVSDVAQEYDEEEIKRQLKAMRESTIVEEDEENDLKPNQTDKDVSKAPTSNKTKKRRGRPRKK